MMRPGAAPLGEQFAILIVGPLVMACLMWLGNRAWARANQGGTASERTKVRQKIEFWMVLLFMYVLGFGMALDAWLT